MTDFDHSSLPRTALLGACSGVYFLYDNDDLVYIGQGWNCLLRIAEHTRKDSDKVFTHWSFHPVPNELERKALEKELRAKLKPKFNRI